MSNNIKMKIRSRVKREAEIDKKLKDKGFRLLEPYTKLDNKHTIIDNNGFKYYNALRNIVSYDKFPKIYTSVNIYTIENIKTYIKNNNIQTELISEEYINSKLPLLWKCSCGTEFSISLSSFLHDKIQKCEKCRNGRKSRKNTTFNWDYIEAKKMFNDRGYDLITTNINNRNEFIYYTCRKHTDKGPLKILWDSFLRGSGCWYCGREKTGLAKRADEESLKLITESKGFIYVGSEIKENEKGKKYTYTKYICPKHEDKGIQYKISYSMKSSTGKCIYCANVNRKTTEEVIDKIKSISPHIEILSDYTNSSTKLKCRCTIHDIIWETNRETLERGGSCKECKKEKIVKSQVMSNEDFIKRLKEINPKIIPLEEYITAQTPILCECTEHNYKWKVRPSALIYKKIGCPKCTHYHAEQILNSLLYKYKYECTPQKTFSECKDKGVLPFDNYLNDYHILIEYDGEGHYKPIPRGSMTKEDAELQLEKQKIHDKIKDEYCINNNIPLIRIPYWEKDNMEYFLLSKLKELDALTPEANEAINRLELKVN